MKTVVVNTDTIVREWFVVDASNVVLGRLASTISGILMGKTKPAYVVHQDHGDNIIVINSDKVKVTGDKAEKKEYFRHSTQPGGDKTRTFKEQIARDSTFVIRRAISGMLPKTALGRAHIRKLHVYGGATHPHAGQNPKPLAI